MDPAVTRHAQARTQQRGKSDDWENPMSFREEMGGGDGGAQVQASSASVNRLAKE